MRDFKVLIFLILLIIGNVISEVSYRQKIPSTYWRSDSLWVGAGLLVKNSDSEVVVTWVPHLNTLASLSQLSCLIPGYEDTAKLLFYNNIDTLNQQKEINLGKFPKGTPVIFCCAVIDTGSNYAYFKGLNLFTGQNRVSIDQFVSTRPSETNLFQKRFAIAGKVGTSVAEVGYYTDASASFWDLRFQVKNVVLEVIEKNIVSIPRITPQSTSADNGITITISVPPTGLIGRKGNLTTFDTIWSYFQMLCMINK